LGREDIMAAAAGPVPSLLKLGYRAASRVLYGRGDYAEWAYERMQRPASALGLMANMTMYAARRPAVPFVVSMAVEPVFGCNLRCMTCWGRYEREMTGLRPHLMEWDLFCRAIDEAPQSVESVTLALAGEPLLHPELPRMIERIAATGRRATLVTNGTRLVGELAERIADSPLSVLTLSVETDAELARKVRGVDQDALRRNLERFVSIKRPGTAVRLSLTVHPENEDRLDRLQRDWGALVDGIKVSPFLWRDEQGGRTRCLEPWRGNLCVLTSGDVTPCCFDLGAHLSFGSLRESGFGEILAGRRRRGVLAVFLSGKLEDRCGRCRQFVTSRLPRRISK
jgi:MoaA/NifB/PqqE/SkfB family radical SAM enzyme